MLVKTRQALHLWREGGWPAVLQAATRRWRRRRPLYTMLTPAELAWTTRYAHRDFTGAGRIIDLGCWLGSSTSALARGLSANQGPAASLHVVHAYDRFVWEAWMEPNVAGTPLAGKYRPGDSFVADFFRQIHPWRDWIAVHGIDLLKLHAYGPPIEFLFIDVMKSWSLANRVIAVFFPHLIPGRSLILHQDFAHYYTSWIPLLVWRFRDCFEPVLHIAGSPSVVFRLVRSLPADVGTADFSFASFEAAEFEAAFTYALGLVDHPARPEIVLARVMAFVHQGDHDRAAWELAEARKHHDLRTSPGLRHVEAALG